jgi:putative Mn2+ efflux pump MntP
MQIIEIVFIALALSIDAFAISVAAATAGHIDGARAALRLSFHFGFFQFLMPILGWAAGATLEPLIAPWDHWLAFFLLLIVGVRMLISSPETSSRLGSPNPTRGLTLLTLATATSIDALAVGLSLAILRITVWFPSIAIGLITAFVSLMGILLGASLRYRFRRSAEIMGGLVLILIAIRIVLSHTILSKGY